MKQCNETITIFNRRCDPETDFDVWVPTVVYGVSWHCSTETAVTDSGLVSALKCVIRIPSDADFGGKTIVPSWEYAGCDPGDAFTLTAGDIIAKGAHTEPVSLSELRKSHETVTIIGSTDNTHRPRGGHYKVVCR